MKKGRQKKMISLFLAGVLVMEGSVPGRTVDAAAKAKLSDTSVTLTVGKTKTVTLKRGSKKVKNVKWSSADKKIATVSQAGKIKAVKAGKTKITATAEKKKYTCKVTVKAKKKEDTSKTPAAADTPVSAEPSAGVAAPVLPSASEGTGAAPASGPEAGTDAPALGSAAPEVPGTEQPPASPVQTGEGQASPSASGEASEAPASPAGDVSAAPSAPADPSAEPGEDKEIILTQDQLKKSVTPFTKQNYVAAKYAELNEETGQTEVKDTEVLKTTVSWTAGEDGKYHLPQTAEELSWIKRTNGKADADEDDGRFTVAALFFCALKAYTPETADEFDAMMDLLCTSPTAKARGLNGYPEVNAQNIKIDLNKKLDGVYKYTYMGNAYFKGAEPKNQYTPDAVPAVVLEDFVYAPEDDNTGLGVKVYKVVMRFAGADSERLLSVYKDPLDGQWYIFNGSYMGFSADIRRPDITAEEAAPYLKETVYEKADQPVVKTEEVIRQAQDPENASKVVDQPVIQANICFTNNGKNVLPSTADQLAKLDRSVGYDSSKTTEENLENDQGRFLTIAAYFAALKAWTPETADEVYEMMELLCESPTTKCLSEDVFTNFGKEFFKTNLTKTFVENHPKYTYCGNSYFDGASPYNTYTPSEPLAVTVEDYVYNGIWSDVYQTMIYSVVTRFDGADSERLLKVYQDRFDHQWYIFSDSYKGFIADCKNPIPGEDEVKASYKKAYGFYAGETAFAAADQPEVKVSQVGRQYAEKDENGNTIIKDINIPQAKISFSKLPASAADLKKIDRGGDYENIGKSGNVKKDQTDDLGRFVTIAAYFAALKRYDKYNYMDAFAMMSVLCESPTSHMLSGGVADAKVFNEYSKSFMKDALEKEQPAGTPKYSYLPNSYYDGADRFNGYTPSEPLTVTVEDYVYDGLWSSDYNTYIYTVLTRFSGADSERLLKVYQDQYDHQWYIFSDSWKGFTADIREPEA